MKFPAIIILALASLCLSVAAEIEGVIPDPGFEIWNPKRNLPFSEAGQWCIWNQDRGVFSVFEQNATEVHSGRYSLHLKGTPNVNASCIFYEVPPEKLEALKGKTLVFSAWIKRVSGASGNVGIGVGGHDSEENGFGKSEWTLDTGALPWLRYVLKYPMPKKLNYLRLYLTCKSDNEGVGDAYFDDLSVETEDTPKASAMASDSRELKVFSPEGLDIAWTADKFGRDLFFQTVWAAEFNDKVFYLGALDGPAGQFSGLRINAAATDRRLVIDAPNELQLVLKLKSPIDVNVQLKGTDADCVAPLSKTGEEWRETAVPLRSFSGIEKLKDLKDIVFQLPANLSKGEALEIAGVKLVSTGSSPAFSWKETPKVAQMRQEIASHSMVFKSDPYKRPSIEGGVFHMQGKPVFYTAPICPSFTFLADFTPNARKYSNDPLYTDLPNPKTLAQLRFNTFGFTSEPLCLMPMWLQNYCVISENRIAERNIARSFLDGMSGTPFFADLSQLPDAGMRILKETKLWRPEMEQQNSIWHDFVPLCMENPACDKVLTQEFKDTAREILSNHGNPFSYELFNEPVYNCQCEFNRAAFGKELEKKFKSIDQLNRAWSTEFSSFDEAAFTKSLEKTPGLWAEWCKFSGTKYAETLKKYINVIKSVDQRKNVYFTEQPVVLSILTGQDAAGMDYRKVAEVLDILGIEGGWSYGRDAVNRRADIQGNVLESALNSVNAKYSFICDFFQNLAKNQKPVVDHEHYCARFEFGKRVPSQKTDFTTTFWNQIMHGMDGALLYLWDKRSFDWRTFEEAKANVYNGGYKAYSLLNPYNYTRESLDGIKQFRDELDGLDTIVMPKPRQQPARIGIVYSYPSMRNSAVNGRNVISEVMNLYHWLLTKHYPMRIVMEEELGDADIASLDMLIAPAMHFSYPETVGRLTSYVKKGGKLFLCNDALANDENGRLIDSVALTGITRSACAPYRTELTVSGTSAAVEVTRRASVKSASAIDTDNSGNVLLSMNKIGSGRVFYFAASGDSVAAEHALEYAVNREKISKYIDIVPEDSKELNETEAALIDRGDTKVLFAVNWEDRGSRLARIQIPQKVRGTFYVTDYVTKKHYLAPDGNRVWTGEALAKGVLTIIPPQQRTILLLQRQVPFAVMPVSEAQVRCTFAEIAAKEADGLKKQTALESAAMAERLKGRSYPDVNASKCVPLDIHRQVNMGFADEVAGDKKGGWSDQGINDYALMPTGKQTLANVPFKIIVPAENQGRSAIVLAGKPRPYFPKEVSGIAVDTQARYIYFLHTACWGVDPGQPAFNYKINYADGTSKAVAPVMDQDVAAWGNPEVIPNAKIAHESHNGFCERIGIYCWRWSNPSPEKLVKSIDISSLNNDLVPIIVGITVERP